VQHRVLLNLGLIITSIRQTSQIDTHPTTSQPGGAAGCCSFEMSTTQRHCPSASMRQIDILRHRRAVRPRNSELVSAAHVGELAIRRECGRGPLPLSVPTLASLLPPPSKNTLNRCERCLSFRLSGCAFARIPGVWTFLSHDQRSRLLGARRLDAAFIGAGLTAPSNEDRNVCYVPETHVS
jgi:hypothetical protein